MNGSGQLFLAYSELSQVSSGTAYTTGPMGQLSLGSWRNISLRGTANGAGASVLSLYEDGQQVGQAGAIDLGTQGVGAFAIGNIYTPSGQATSGQLYFDDVIATTTPADQAQAARVEKHTVGFVSLPRIHPARK